MAANRAKCSLPLVVYDINLRPERIPPSAIVAQSLQQIADTADVVFISVPDGAASMAVIEGLLTVSNPRMQCLISLSTVGIDDNQKLTDAVPDGAFD